MHHTTNMVNATTSARKSQWTCSITGVCSTAILVDLVFTMADVTITISIFARII